jgi:hypothetical protein
VDGSIAEDTLDLIRNLSERETLGDDKDKGWRLYDIGELGGLHVEPLSWVVEGLIPSRGIGFMSGAPKDGKSLLALDLVVQIAHVRPWLGRFQTSAVRTLYVAREDPLRRIRERVLEINESYGYGPLTRSAISFLIRERFNLMDPEHIDWLAHKVEEEVFDFLILDVLNRMIPDLDELSAKDMAQMVSVIERLNRDLGLTILLLDHTRKPVGIGSGRNKQSPNPFDLKGSVAKYGAADFMLCVSRTEQDGRLQLYAENKETDVRPHMLIDVSPKGSAEPKFTYAGDVEAMVQDRKALGAANKEKVHAALDSKWNSPAAISERVGLSRSAVHKHLKALESEGRAESCGQARSVKWRYSSFTMETPRGQIGGNADEH